MRRLACLAFAACCFGTPALAQSGPPASGSLPSPEDVSKRDMITIGVGGAFVPDYEGSDDYRLIPAGAIRAKIHGYSISTNGPYLYVDVIPASGKVSFDAGPIVGLRFDDRQHSDDSVVKLMVKRKTAFELGGFAGLTFHGVVDPYDSLSIHLDVLHDVGNAYRSTVYDPNVSFSTPISRRTYVSLSAGAELVGHKFAQYYFGVTPADVVSTGGALPLYDPNGGLKSWKTSLLVNQSITGDLLHGMSIFGMVQYSRLVGDFKRSPIVAERGSPNQFLGALGLAYTF